MAFNRNADVSPNSYLKNLSQIHWHCEHCVWTFQLDVEMLLMGGIYFLSGFKKSKLKFVWNIIKFLLSPKETSCLICRVDDGWNIHMEYNTTNLLCFYWNVRNLYETRCKKNPFLISTRKCVSNYIKARQQTTLKKTTKSYDVFMIILFTINFT